MEVHGTGNEDSAPTSQISPYRRSSSLFEQYTGYRQYERECTSFGVQGQRYTEGS